MRDREKRKVVERTIMKIILSSLFVVVYIVIAIVTNKWIKRKLTEKYKRTRNKPYTAEDRDLIDVITLGTIISVVIFAILFFDHPFYVERITKDANIKVLSMDASIGGIEGHNYVVKLEYDGTIYNLKGKENFNKCFGKVNKEIKGKVIKRTRLDKTVWNTIKLE